MKLTGTNSPTTYTTPPPRGWVIKTCYASAMWFPDNNPLSEREQTIEYSSKHKLVTNRFAATPLGVGVHEGLRRS